MFCTKCGKENKDDDRFCIHCGAALSKQGAPTTEKASRGLFWQRFALVAVTALIIIAVLLATFLSHTTTAPPLVSTNDATRITANSATLNGDLTALGSTPNVDVSFQWGTRSKHYSNKTTAVARTDTGTFSSNITGLTSNTTYYYRAKAVGDGTGSGSEMSFSTP